MPLHLPTSQRGKLALIAALFTVMCLVTVNALAGSQFALTAGIFLLSAVLFASMIAFGEYWSRGSRSAPDARFEVARSTALRWSYVWAVGAVGATGLGTVVAPRHATEIAAAALYLSICAPAALLIYRSRREAGTPPGSDGP